MTTTVYLVDASPYIFRAFFSIPSKMTNAGGSSVNAVFGFNHFLRLLRERESVSHVGLTFDQSLTTSFRNELYPAYKQQRELPPKALEDQLNWCQALGRALGAATFVDPRYEADDLIATLCRQLTAQGHRVVIVTSDKDLAQLVGDQVQILDFARGERLGELEVVEKLGVEPRQVVDLLALMGDSVDNIPGVKGVGKKSAVALLQAFGTLDNLYARLGEVPGLPLRGAKSLADKLGQQKDMAVLSQRLASLAFDAPASATLDQLRWAEPLEEEVAALRQELGFDPLRSGRGRRNS